MSVCTVPKVILHYSLRSRPFDSTGSGTANWPGQDNSLEWRTGGLLRIMMEEKQQIPLPRVKLGGQALEVSRLGFGCARLSGLYNTPLSHEAGCSIIEEAFKGESPSLIHQISMA
ncbi:hypothetical protein FH972_008440 [Carpinus fangiana]|uniref:Uncharacterized protein n=1 Tax=Carpinus fangiana TaxID=176857 RepID=A0A5N6QYQ3_9ROSI|nr:hypothetical protein FH972_008440 [Carpinus fangiana]